MTLKSAPRRRRRVSIASLLILIAASTIFGLLVADLRSVDPSPELQIRNKELEIEEKEESWANTTNSKLEGADVERKCATVEEMGKIFSRGYVGESLRVRRIIRNHFAINGASRVRELPPEQFCKHGFVIAKASEAGLGNELYKILTAAALSVMLNRSLIIGQTRGKYPFGDYISYSDVTLTLKEVKHLWKQNRCLTKYRKHLTMRIDDFQKPSQTNVLCSNWKEWEQPIIWFQNATDAVAAQFFLKNIHPVMREAAADLFGRPENLQYRANVFGELMKILISPSKDVEKAVNWALGGGRDPDITLHMRMMMNRSIRAMQAAVHCLRKAVHNLPTVSKPKVVLVSDTPSMVNNIALTLEEFSEVLHFDYENFEGNISGNSSIMNFRRKDWGPAPRWVAFVDFFLASRAKHAVVSGAHRRVGTTYAQLIAALAAAYRLDDDAAANSSITFLSSFQSPLLADGLRRQVGWGHVWNRFAGPLSCRGQPTQCALTPVLPPGWWDGLWQSPIPRDIRRMEAYGMKLSGFGTFDETQLSSFCQSRRKSLQLVHII